MYHRCKHAIEVRHRERNTLSWVRTVFLRIKQLLSSAQFTQFKLQPRLYEDPKCAGSQAIFASEKSLKITPISHMPRLRTSQLKLALHPKPVFLWIPAWTHGLDHTPWSLLSCNSCKQVTIEVAHDVPQCHSQVFPSQMRDAWGYPLVN